jgi:hypothetical protein
MRRHANSAVEHEHTPSVAAIDVATRAERSIARRFRATPLILALRESP